MRGNVQACQSSSDSIMAKVVMYTTGFCPYCKMAENLLHSKGVEQIDKIRIDLDPEQRLDMMEKTGRRTVPQIYIGDRYIGGYDDLARLDHQGELMPLLEK